jgi:Tol biopolymer transport system component
LVYQTSSGAGDRINWLDRQGRVVDAVGEPTAFALSSQLAVSPDGKRVAFVRTDAVSGNTDIYLFEFSRA